MVFHRPLVGRCNSAFTTRLPRQCSRIRNRPESNLSLPIILSDAKAFEINDIKAYATSAPQQPDPIVTMLHLVRIALDGVFSRHKGLGPIPRQELRLL